MVGPKKGFRGTVAERLDKRSVFVPWSGCLIWLGGLTTGGYGLLAGDDDELVYAHRAAWQTANGPIPEGQFVLHRCDVRCCINVSHLFLGSHADNMHDAEAKGRNAKGERHGNAKLTDIEVAAIRADKRASRVTAADYGIDPRYVRSLRSGDWRST